MGVRYLIWHKFVVFVLILTYVVFPPSLLHSTSIIPVSYHYENIPYPSAGTYYIMDTYKIIPGRNLLLFPALPDFPGQMTVDNYGCLYIYNIDENTSKCISFNNASPIQEYVVSNKIFVIVQVYQAESPDQIYPSPIGWGIYELDLDSFSIIAEKTIIEKYTYLIIPFKDALVLNSKEFIIPLTITVNDETYNRLYKVSLDNNGFKLEKIFEVKTDYHVYLKPIIYDDRILWGPYIIDKQNYTLLDDLRENANVTHMSLVIDNTYIITRYYDYPNYTALEVVYYSLKNNTVYNKVLLFNESKGDFESALLDYGIYGDRYLLYIVSHTINGLDIFLPKYIEIYTYDAINKKTILHLNYSAREYYLGEYFGNKLIGLAGNGKLLLINPTYNLTKEIHLDLLKRYFHSSVGLGELSLYYDHKNDRYIMVLLPVMGDSYYIVFFDKDEISPLSENILLPIIIFIFVLGGMFRKIASNNR